MPESLRHLIAEWKDHDMKHFITADKSHWEVSGTPHLHKLVDLVHIGYVYCAIQRCEHLRTTQNSYK